MLSEKEENRTASFLLKRGCKRFTINHSVSSGLTQHVVAARESMLWEYHTSQSKRVRQRTLMPVFFFTSGITLIARSLGMPVADSLLIFVFVVIAGQDHRCS